MKYEEGMIAINERSTTCVCFWKNPLSKENEWTLKKIPWTSGFFGTPFWHIEETTQIEQVAVKWVQEYNMKMLDSLPTLMDIYNQQKLSKPFL